MSQDNHVPIGTFCVFVEASVSEHCYNCMSNEHRSEVDTQICQIEHNNDYDVNHYYDEIRDLVTRYVQLYNG
jgi:hypothetical protein